MIIRHTGVHSTTNSRSRSRLGQPVLGHTPHSDNSTLTFNNSRTTEEKTVLFGFVVYAAFCDVNTYCGLRNKPFVNHRKTFSPDNRGKQINGANREFFF